jgi:hypothetical protein
MGKWSKKKVLVLSLVLLAVLAVILTAVLLWKPGKSGAGAKSTEPSEQTEDTEEIKDVPIRGEIPADKPALVVKGTKAKAGDKQVEVIVEVVNNPGILGMDFDLYYDDTVLTLTDAQSLLEIEGCEYTPAAYYKNPTTFLWDFQDPNWTQDGAVLKLCFDIAENAPAGKYEIKIMYSYGNILGAELQAVDLGVKNGNITISE